MYITNALTFLITTAFDFYILAIMLRFLFQLFRADFYNPISQFLVKITNPVLRPLRQLIPGVQGIDVASIALMLGLKILEISLLALIKGFSVSPFGIILLSIAELLEACSQIFFIAIFIQVLISWIAPGVYNPSVVLIDSLVEPILRPLRKRIPTAGGLDLSPMVALIILHFISITLIAWLSDTGYSMM